MLYHKLAHSETCIPSTKYKYNYIKLQHTLVYFNIFGFNIFTYTYF